MQRMLEALNEHGYDLTPAELAVMTYPGPDGKRPSELARACATSRQSMNYLLSGLEARGYLRRADGDEGLARVVQLTERGRAAGKLMSKTVEQIEREWIGFLGKDRFDCPERDAARPVEVAGQGALTLHREFCRASWPLATSAWRRRTRPGSRSPTPR